MNDMTPIADILEKARSLMADGCWCMGRNFNHGSYCLLGAIRMAVSGNPYGKGVMVDVVKVYLHPYVGKTGVTLYNDLHTWEEVDALLEQAIKDARG